MTADAQLVRSVIGNASHADGEGFIDIDLDNLLERSVLKESRYATQFLVDRSGKLLATTPWSAELLVDPLPLVIDDGQLRATDANAAKNLATLLEMVGPNRQRKLVHNAAGNHWVLIRCWEVVRKETKIIFMHCRASRPRVAASQSGIAEDFGLTRTESAVLDAFADLAKPKEIAERLRISVNTVRSHLKQIHVKLSVHSGTELMLLTRAYCDQ